MTDREKLIELVGNVRRKITAWHTTEDIADILIANGATIQMWIPVSERLPEELPKDSCAWSERVRPSVDVLVKIKGLKQLYTAWYSYSYKEWVDVREEHSFTGVTHWMPLPEPPQEK
jgi:hypothetical protein